MKRYCWIFYLLLGFNTMLSAQSIETLRQQMMDEISRSKGLFAVAF
jgi:hypothetical protein